VFVKIRYHEASVMILGQEFLQVNFSGWENVY